MISTIDVLNDYEVCGLPKHYLQVITKEKSAERIESSLFHRDMHYTDIPQEYHQLPENDKCVYDAIRHNGHVTRNDLVNICSLPRTTIYDALVRLQRLELIDQHQEDRTTRGRPKIFFGLPHGSFQAHL